MTAILGKVGSIRNTAKKQRKIMQDCLEQPELKPGNHDDFQQFWPLRYEATFRKVSIRILKFSKW